MPIFLLLYLVFALAEILALGLQESYPQLVFFTKPVLMLLLAGYFYQETQGKRSKIDIGLFVALFFAWLGDVFLMFTKEIFFLLGLASFLVTHLCYIFIFKKDFSISNSRFFFVPFLLLAAYGFRLLTNVLPNLPDDMTIPVAIYSFTILAMVATAIGRKGNVSRESHNLVLIGAVAFMFSDSLIAMNKFVSPIPYANIWIMLLYMTGQLLIVRGYLAGNKE